MTKLPNPETLKARLDFTEPLLRDERNYLNKLSLEAYGTSSKWKKMVENGEKVPNTETKTFSIVRYSVEEIKKIMEETIAEEKELKVKEAEEKQKMEAIAAVQKEKIEEEQARLELEAEALKSKDKIKTILETVES